MGDLTARQIEILQAIIQEYTETGEPVGSEILEKKYKIGVSPATLRNEMVKLAEKDYLVKSYVSAGRVPSARAMRFYIKHLMKERKISIMDEVAYKSSIWDERVHIHKLFAHASRILAQKTRLLSIIVTSSGEVYYSGVANLMNLNEFENVERSRSLFQLLDEEHFWNQILNIAKRSDDEIVYIVGEEDFQNPTLETCAGVVRGFEGTRLYGLMGVFGPKRMRYEVVAPQLRYFASLIEDIVRNAKE